MSKDFYAIVFKSGQFVKRNNTDEFFHLPLQTIECFLYARYDRTFSGPSNTTDWYQFYFVDRNGQPTTYKVGNYEVIYLSADDGCTNFFGRVVTIRDCRTEKYYEYKSRIWYDRFVPDELRPLLERLNQVTDEDEIIRLIKAHIPYDKLEKKYRELRLSYDSLKEESEKMKSVMTSISSALSDIQKSIEDNC